MWNRDARPLVVKSAAGLGAIAAMAAVVTLGMSLFTVSSAKASVVASSACRASNLSVSASSWSAPGWTRTENRHPGTAAWRPHIVPAGAQGPVQGFLQQVSVAPGQPLTLFVKARQRWRWSVYRLGYYRGAGARMYASSCWKTPMRQPNRVVSRSMRTVSAPWKQTLRIREQWPPGLYLMKLTSSQGGQSYVPLLVRSPSVSRRTVFMYSAMTMQAYNHWGGRSLYLGPDDKAPSRSYADSFDRPYDSHLILKMLGFEQPLVAESERLGLRLAYVTDVDVATRPRVLVGARTLMTDGHDEYWTLSERQAILAARDRGTNLLFFGANQMWWQVRLANTKLGPGHLVICYKAASDPIVASNPELRTTHFRSLPRPLPESRLIGVQYAGLDANAPFRVSMPGFFAFAHTGAHRGSSYPGLVGPEIDMVNPGRNSPPTLEIVGRSPAACRGVRCLSDATYYTVRSGAAVWAAGTNGWVNALGSDSFEMGVTPATRRFVRTVTDNLLLAFARGPAGLAHRARANVTRFDGSPTRFAVSTRYLDSSTD